MSASQDVATSLEHGDFPGLFQAADEASMRGQNTYLRALRMRLILSVLAAVCGAVTISFGPTDIAALGTALFFVGALGVDALVFHSRPDQTWYQGRALAESSKTLTWRYAVGGAPFPLGLPAEKADQLFVDRLAELQGDLGGVPLLPTRAAVISDRMRALRAAPLAERAAAYLTGRIENQQSWYADKARFHQRRASLYRRLVLLCEIAGVAAALARAISVVRFDLAGIIAATVAALAAWSSARQHTTTAQAYVVATHDLGLAREQLQHRSDEAAWAAGVADTEAAISREHSTWRSSKGE